MDRWGIIDFPDNVRMPLGSHCRKDLSETRTVFLQVVRDIPYKADVLQLGSGSRPLIDVYFKRAIKLARTARPGLVVCTEFVLNTPRTGGPLSACVWSC
jgi:hypothetical protein